MPFSIRFPKVLRSRMGWAGAAMLAMIFWTWWDSTRYRTYFSLRWHMPGGAYQGFGAGSSSHRVWVWMGRPHSGLFNLFQETGFHASRRENNRVSTPWRDSLPDAIAFELQSTERGRLNVSVDYWFVASSAAVLWAGGMGWLWMRRRAKAGKGAES